jgi:tetratricopeptide (TPR) repeat protein
MAERTELIQLASTHLDILAHDAPRNAPLLLELADAYLALSGLSEHLKNAALMLDAASKARDSLESLNDNSTRRHLALLNAYRALQAAYSLRGETGQAIQAGLRANALSQNLLKQHPDEPHVLLSRLMTLDLLSESLSKGGRTADAVRLVREFVPSLPRLKGLSPAETLRVGRAEAAFGDLMARYGDDGEARRLRRQGLERLFQLRRVSPYVEGANDPAELVSAIALIQLALEDNEGAGESLRHAIRIREVRLESDPAWAFLRYQHGVSHFLYGRILSQNGRPQEALEHFQQAQRTLEQVYREKRDPNALQLAARALTAAGKLHFAARRHEEAMSSFRQALAWRREVAAVDPGSRYHQREVSFSHLEIGDALAAQHRLDEAAKEFRQAVAIREELLRRDPASAELQEDLRKAKLRLEGARKSPGAAAAGSH